MLWVQSRGERIAGDYFGPIWLHAIVLKWLWLREDYQKKELSYWTVWKDESMELSFLTLCPNNCGFMCMRFSGLQGLSSPLRPLKRTEQQLSWGTGLSGRWPSYLLARRGCVGSWAMLASRLLSPDWLGPWGLFPPLTKWLLLLPSGEGDRLDWCIPHHLALAPLSEQWPGWDWCTMSLDSCLCTSHSYTLIHNTRQAEKQNLVEVHRTASQEHEGMHSPKSGFISYDSFVIIKSCGKNCTIKNCKWLCLSYSVTFRMFHFLYSISFPQKYPNQGLFLLYRKQT